ncbi:50S ribosomal protein L10 [Phycisphaerae bacterium RAS1]|nr:50S ribosomal protein L10 [Phycisphaerae bacterium RAS1]
MSKPVKSLMTQELQGRYAALDSAVWVDVVGIDGLSTNEFRRSLHSKKMKLEVVKTALFRRAVADTPMARLGDALTGPVGLITGGDSPIEVAKLLDDWAPKLKTLKLRGALLEGEYIGEPQVGQLSKMPTKRDMQGRVAGCARSPGANLAAAIKSGGGRVAGCLKALIEKLEKQEAPAA